MPSRRISGSQNRKPPAVSSAESARMAITEVDTAVFMRAVSFAPNNWLMMTEQPVLLPSATAMKIMVIG